MAVDKSTIPMSNDNSRQAIQVGTVYKTTSHSAGVITPLTSLVRIYNPEGGSVVKIKHYKGTAESGDVGMSIPSGMIEYINVFDGFLLSTDGTIEITWMH
jgi:hypothetical protein